MTTQQQIEFLEGLQKGASPFIYRRLQECIETLARMKDLDDE